MLARLPAGAAMSEPCRHEREFAGTQADTLTSFVKSNAELVKAQSEVKALRATLAKVAHLCDVATALAATKLVSGETEDAIVAFVTDVREVLEPTPKGTKP